MIDPVRYYDLERYLFTDVAEHFRRDGSIGAFDFFSIVIWKANRAKRHIAKRLRRQDSKRRKGLEPIVRDLTRSLAHADDAKARLRLLRDDWKFGLPMATAILTVLWPEEFTIYDMRVCEQLRAFARLASATSFETVWEGYSAYREAVRSSVEAPLSLRDKDRYLWARSVIDQLKRDIASGFAQGGG